jgi:hypothetical protein
VPISTIKITNHKLFFQLDLAGIGVVRNSIYPAVGYIRNITINHNTVYMSLADACLRLNGLTNSNILISNNVLYCENQSSITSSVNLAGEYIY